MITNSSMKQTKRGVTSTYIWPKGMEKRARLGECEAHLAELNEAVET
jgi:hypothetical protein